MNSNEFQIIVNVTDGQMTFRCLVDYNEVLYLEAWKRFKTRRTGLKNGLYKCDYAFDSDSMSNFKFVREH